MSAFHVAAPLACAGLWPIAGTVLYAQRRRLLTASAKWCPGGCRPRGYAAPSANLSYSGGLCVVVLRSERGENRNEAVDDPGAFAGDVAGACTGRWAKSSIVVRPNVLQARSVLRPHGLRALVEQQIHQGQRRRGLLDLALGSVVCRQPGRDRRYGLTRREDSLLLPKRGDHVRRTPRQYVMQLRPSNPRKPGHFLPDRRLSAAPRAE